MVLNKYEITFLCWGVAEMPKIWVRVAWDISEIYLRYAWNMLEKWQRYAWYLVFGWYITDICLIYSRDRYAWDSKETLTDICKLYLIWVWDMPQKWMKSHWDCDMRERFLRYALTIILIHAWFIFLIYCLYILPIYA